MLSKDFFDQTHLQYSVLRNRSVKKLDNVTEQLEILRINDDTARISHHVSILLNHEHLTTTQPNSKTLLSKIENLHLFNKLVLKQSLIEPMCVRVGLYKPPSK